MTANPKFWGRPSWIFLYSVVDNFQEQHSAEYRQFFYNLQYTLPCRFCREHYAEHIKLMPITFTNKQEAKDWLRTLYSTVNKGKPIEQLLDNNKNTIYLSYSLFEIVVYASVLILLFCFLIKNKKKKVLFVE